MAEQINFPLLADLIAKHVEHHGQTPAADDLAELIRFASIAPEATAYKIPGPYDIAMAFGPALLASGQAENIGAAMQSAWAAVPLFYQGRDFYLREIAPAVYPTEPEPAP